MKTMKKIKILTTVAFVSIASIAISQSSETDNRERFQVGLKAGLNYSNVYNTQSEEFRADSKFGFVGGAVIHIPIGTYLGFQPEVLFSQKGFKGEGKMLGFEYNFSRTTSYIDIPLQIALKPSEFITLVAGPQYSYLLSQKDEFSSTIYSDSQIKEFENDNIRKNILGLVAGVDINLKNIVLGARLNWDIQNNKGDGSSNTPKYKNRWLQGTIGFKF